MSTPRERLSRAIFPNQYGSRLGRYIYALGDWLQEFACRRCGIDRLNSDAFATGVWRHVENVGARLTSWHSQRVFR